MKETCDKTGPKDGMKKPGSPRYTYFKTFHDLITEVQEMEPIAKSFTSEDLKACFPPCDPEPRVDEKILSYRYGI